MEQPGTRVMIQRVICGSTEADFYLPSGQNEQVERRSNANYTIGPPIGLGEILRMKRHLCQYFSKGTLSRPFWVITIPILHLRSLRPFWVIPIPILHLHSLRPFWVMPIPILHLRSLIG